MRDLSRQVELYCSVCGGSQFAFEEGNGSLAELPGDTKITCAHCDWETTKDELIEANAELINRNIEEVKAEAVKEFKDELKRSLRKLSFK